HFLYHLNFLLLIERLCTRQRRIDLKAEKNKSHPNLLGVPTQGIAKCDLSRLSNTALRSHPSRRSSAGQSQLSYLVEPSRLSLRPCLGNAWSFPPTDCHPGPSVAPTTGGRSASDS